MLSLAFAGCAPPLSEKEKEAIAERENREIKQIAIRAPEATSHLDEMVDNFEDQPFFFKNYDEKNRIWNLKSLWWFDSQSARSRPDMNIALDCDDRHIYVSEKMYGHWWADNRFTVGEAPNTTALWKKYCE